MPLALRALYQRWSPELARCRLELGRGHVLVVVVVLAIGLVAAAVVYSLGRPDAEPVGAEVMSTGTRPAPEPSHDVNGNAEGRPDGGAGEPVQREGGTGAGDPASSGDPAGQPDLVVHVAGKVARPGVISLPTGSRVVDAIEAAGGADGDVDLTPLNLARVLTDGEQLLVGVEPPPGQRQPPSESGVDEPPAQINLNTASGQELASLPGIGPVLAERIIAWRTQHTRFTSVDELLEVSGIGPSTLSDIEDLVVV